MKPARFAISCLPLLFLLVCAPPALGRLPQAERIPANSILAVGVDNTAAAWKKIEALPLTVAVRNYLTTGTMANNLDWQSFLLEQQKLGEKTGFPVTPAEIMGNVFSNVAAYAVQGKESGSYGFVVLAGVKDRAKAAKLIQVFNEDVSAPTSDTLSEEQPKLEKIKIAGVDAWHLSDSSDLHVYYGLTGHGFVAGDSLEQVTAAMAEKAAGPGIGTNPQFNRLRDAINWDESDVCIWYDADAVLAMQPQVASALKGLAGKTNKYAITFNVMRDGIVGRSVTGADPAPKVASEQISMSGLKMIGASPLFAADYGLFDAKDIINQLNQFGGSMGAMGGMGGMDLSSSVSAFEEATSISLKNELAPALGTELIAAVNNFTPNTGGPMPNIDIIVGAKVKNAKLMQQVMTKFEKSLEVQMANNMVAAAMNGNAPTTPTFQTSTIDGMKIRSLRMQTGMVTLTPSYTITNGYLILSISPEAVQAAGRRLQGKQPGLDKSPAYQALRQIAGSEAKPFSFSLLDVNHIAQKVVRPFLPLMASGAGVDMQDAMIIIDQIVSRTTTFASLDTRQGGLTRSYIKLQMK
ncbi:MAG: hypothetical protein ABFD69_02590 [Candidatus Sumerlaeia bacterium]